MAPRKSIRREGESSSTATLNPPAPPVSAPPVTQGAASKFIEARPAVDVHAAPTKQAIRDRAYQLYLARNGQPGDANSDWLQAERELAAETRRGCS